MLYTRYMGKRGYRGRYLVGTLATVCAVAIVFCLSFATSVSGRDSGAGVLFADQVSNGDRVVQSHASNGTGYQPAQEVSADGTVVLQGEYDPDIVIVQIGQGNDAAALTQALSHVPLLDGAAVSVTDADVQAGYAALPLAQGAGVADAIAALGNVEGIVGAQPNYIYHLFDNSSDEASGARLIAGSVNSGLLEGTALLDALADVNDPSSKQEASASYNWHLKSINAYEAWETTKGESPAGDAPCVTVAVLDTGYDLDHEDLTAGAQDGIGGNVVAAYDATANADEHYNTGVADIEGHGTHVAGLVAAVANNEKGVAGVSHNAKVLPIQVFHEYTEKGQTKNGASSLSVKTAFDYVCQHAEEYNIRVANLSLGANQSSMGAHDRLLVSAVDEAWAKGVLTVCAAGNGASSGPYRVFPGDFLNHGMTVIALDSNRKMASYSNRNLDEIETYKDISAPGTSVYSTTYDGAYGFKSGTSMATPIVSGVAALVWSQSPQLDPGDVIDILHGTALDLTPENSGTNTKVGFDQCTGYGEVDAQAAVARAGGYLMGDSTLLVGDSLTLVPASEAPSGTWAWSSSNDEVATVADGVVTGVAGGTATITATSGDLEVEKAITVFDISFALAEDGVNVDELTKVEEIEIEPEETLHLWFNENPNTGLWLIGSSDTDVMNVSVPGNDDISVEGVAGGEAYVEATLKENPKLVVRAKVIVRDADNPFALESPRAQVEWPEGPWTFNGQAIQPEPTVTFTYGYGSKARTETLVRGVDYTVEYADNVSAGTATATVAGKGKFAGSVSHEFEIARVSLADAAVIATGWIQDDTVHNPDVRVMFGWTAVPSEGNWSYEVHQGDASGPVVAVDAVLPAGEYTVVVTGEGNYEGTATATFTVTEPAPVVPVKPDDPDPNNPDNPDNPDTPANPDNPDTPDSPDTPVSPDNPDTPTTPDTPVEPDKPDPSQPIFLTAATVKLAQANCVYSGAACTPAVVSVTLPSGVVLGPGDYEVAYSNNQGVGWGTITVTGKGVYVGSISRTFQITHRVTAASFTDFEAGAWYLRESPGEGAFTGEGDTRTLYIDYIVAKGIMSGYDDGSGRFGVNDLMTRGQLVTMLYRATTGETAQTTNNSVRPRFADTSAGMYYSTAVEWASRNNIVTGYNDGSNRFGPDDPVTREQMATIVYRYAAFCGADMTPAASLTGYSDWRAVSSWARRAMSYCVAIRAMGYGGATLNPRDGAPRIQAAKVVAVILHDIVDTT